MHYRSLGNTGILVSALGLGGFHLGLASESDSFTIIETALANGITLFDNSWSYHNGMSEERVGKALKNRRQQVILMSKIDGRDSVTAEKQLNDSLFRLKTDYLDILEFHEIIHDDDSGHKDPQMIKHMLDVADQNDFHFDVVQMPLNVLDFHFRSFHTLLPILAERGIGILGMKSCCGGFVPKTITYSDCVRYALSLPVASVVAGVQSLAILQNHLDIVDQEVSDVNYPDPKGCGAS